ncbi:MAG: MFS transporter [Anaerolineales bacterium]|nr:MFS transporter [Anaerolineales bacterium]
MRTFLIIWIGQVISMLGSGLTGFALGVWIYDQTGQATPFALTVLFGNLPRLLLSPLAGSLADRWNRRWLMILSDTGNALITLAAAVLLFNSTLQIWHIYLIALLGSVCSAFQEPAYTASIAMLVPHKDLGRANGLMSTGQALESLVTPLVAGFLFVAIGLRGIILIDFITYFFAIGALLYVHIPQPAQAPQEKPTRNQIWDDTVFGWNYLRRRSGLFGLLLYFAMVNFSLNFAAVLLGPLVLSVHQASVLGLAQMAMGVGMLAGGILMSAWGGPKRRIRGVIGFIILSGCGLALTGLRSPAIFPILGLSIMLFAVPLASGSSQAIFQTKIAPEVQGRVFAIRSMISRSMMPLAFLLAGPLADYIFEPLMKSGGALAASPFGALLGTGPGRGVGLMFVFAGLTTILVSAVVALNPRIRRVEEELPDMLPTPEVSEPCEAVGAPAASTAD